MRGRTGRKMMQYKAIIHGGDEPRSCYQDESVNQEVFLFSVKP